MCSACTGQFAQFQSRCSTCALRMPQPLADTPLRCGQCMQHPGPLHACWAAVDYGYPWDTLLAQLKFRGGKGLGSSGPSADPAVARALADIMAAHSGIASALLHASLVIPIPLSYERLRHRGFNQALELGKHLLGSTALRAKLRPDLLLRTRDTAPQMDLARAQRLRNLQHAFAVEPALAHQIQGAQVVLIDDVTTTTATLCAAALALRAAGAAQVVGVVFARTAA